MAIKEEQYDPGYEDAYGGAYADRGAEGDQAPTQTNGHCTFSSAEHRGNICTSGPVSDCRRGPSPEVVLDDSAFFYL